MKVGTVGYACDSGLGILIKAFHDHGIVNEILVIRHGRHPTHDDWYPGAKQISDLHGQRADMEQFVRSLDVFLAFETPFHLDLFDAAHAAGVKTVLMPMYEWTHVDMVKHPIDLFLCPSMLDVREFAWVYPSPMRPFLDTVEGLKGSHTIFAPVPVEVPWRQRTEAKVFVHNAGHGSVRDRNGTRKVWEALQHLKSPVQMLFRSQKDSPRDVFPVPSHIDVRQQIGTVPYDQLWNEGDVFLFPESFNGLSLPLQEARAAGMLVMCADRFPMNTWLPTSVKTGFSTLTFKEKRGNLLVPIPETSTIKDEVLNPLIPVSGYRRARVGGAYLEFDEAIIDPVQIAATIDAWYGKDISACSLQGKEWADSMSWTTLGPQYMRVLEELCRSR